MNRFSVLLRLGRQQTYFQTTKGTTGTSQFRRKTNGVCLGAGSLIYVHSCDLMCQLPIETPNINQHISALKAVFICLSYLFIFFHIFFQIFSHHTKQNSDLSLDTSIFTHLEFCSFPMKSSRSVPQYHHAHLQLDTTTGRRTFRMPWKLSFTTIPLLGREGINKVKVATNIKGFPTTSCEIHPINRWIKNRLLCL